MTVAEKTIRQLMTEDPCGTTCSRCGEEVPKALKGSKAVVCSSCVAKLAANRLGALTTEAAQEAEARKAARAQHVGVLDAAYEILAERGVPMKNDELTAAMLERGHWSSRGSTPAASVYAGIVTDIKKGGEASRFVRTAPNTWGLKKK